MCFRGSGLIGLQVYLGLLLEKLDTKFWDPCHPAHNILGSRNDVSSFQTYPAIAS